MRILLIKSPEKLQEYINGVVGNGFMVTQRPIISSWPSRVGEVVDYELKRIELQEANTTYII